MASHLLGLPHEVLHGILTNIDPRDIASLRCCRTLDDFIQNDRLLYKEIYLQNFDDPSRDAESVEITWSNQLKELVSFQKILESDNAILKSSHLESIAHSVEYLLATATAGSQPSLNISFLTRLFESQQNITALLCGSRLFDWARAESWGHLIPARLRRDIASMLSASPQSHESIDVEVEAAIEKENASEAHRLPDFGSEATAHMYDMFRRHLENGDKAAMIAVNPTQRPHRQLSAKLHCFYGVSIDSVQKDTSAPPRYSLRSDSAPVHPYARSLVYDLRQHTDHNLWGPLQNDGSQDVDWEKLEAIMIVLNHNMRLSTETHHVFEGMMDIQDRPFVGASPHSFISPPATVPMQPALPLEAQDPYNVTGTWMRVVCFLDYGELYDFNFNGETIPDDQPRHPIDTDEAIRLITMKIYVTKVEQPGERDGQRLPVVHFRGHSSSLQPSFDPNANSKIKGSVRLTRQGEVRWTTFSVYHGEERWRSEGIQIGGVQSSRGVLGYWFDKDRDMHGPAGPTAFWKSHDGIEEKKPAGRHSPMTQFTMPMY